MAWTDDVYAQYAEVLPFLRDLMSKSARGDNYSMSPDDWKKVFKPYSSQNDSMEKRVGNPMSEIMSSCPKLVTVTYTNWRFGWTDRNFVPDDDEFD